MSKHLLCLTSDHYPLWFRVPARFSAGEFNALARLALRPKREKGIYNLFINLFPTKIKIAPTPSPGKIGNVIKSGRGGRGVFGHLKPDGLDDVRALMNPPPLPKRPPPLPCARTMQVQRVAQQIPRRQSRIGRWCKGIGGALCFLGGCGLGGFVVALALPSGLILWKFLSTMDNVASVINFLQHH